MIPTHRRGRRLGGGAAAVAMPLLVLAAGSASATPRPQQYDGSRVRLADDTGRLWDRERGAFDVGPTGVPHRARLESEEYKVEEGEKTKTYNRYRLVYQKGTEPPVRKVLATWTDEESFPDVYKPLAVRVDAEDRAWILVGFTHGILLARRSDVVAIAPDGRHEPIVTGQLWTEGRLLLGAGDRPIALGRAGSTLYGAIGGQSSVLSTSVRYDWSVARAPDGWVYVLAHDWRSRSFFASVAREDATTWRTEWVGTAESGWQHSIAMRDGVVWTLFYYYRNAFNKGLRVASLAGGALSAPVTVVRAEDRNAGWSPMLEIMADGQVHARYTDDVEADRTESRRFETMSAWLSQVPPTETGGWEDDYRDWLFVGGPDLSFRFWHIIAPNPLSVPDESIFDATYDYDPALVGTLTFEGRWRSVNLGLNYARGLLGETIEEAAGTTARRAFDLLGGFIGWDELVRGHDLQASASFGRFRGQYQDQSGIVAAETPLRVVTIALLNQYRIRYGLSYRGYGLRQPLYGYLAESGEEGYRFVGSAVRDTDVHRAEVFVGYSKLDYVVKYETRYLGPLIEGDVSGGLALAVFDEASFGTDRRSSAFEPAFGGRVRLGLLYYQRFYGLHGAGIYARVGWGAELLAQGLTPGAPGDRDGEDDDKNRDFQLRAVHFQLQHGPFAGIGLVY